MFSIKQMFPLLALVLGCNGSVTVQAGGAGFATGTGSSSTVATSTATSSSSSTSSSATGTGGSNDGVGGASSSSTTGTGGSGSTTSATSSGGAGEGGNGGMGGGPICSLVKHGEFDIPGASQLHFACSPKSATCILSLVENGLPSQRLFLMSGEELLSPSWALATQASFPTNFVLGTPGGFLASVWENKGNYMTNWLLRTDDLGEVQNATKTTININGWAEIGTSALDGEWVASTFSTPQMSASYMFGKVDDQASIPQTSWFEIPDASPTLGGVARVGNVTGLAASWFGSDSKGHLSLYLKLDGMQLQEVVLASPTNNLVAYKVMGVHELGGEFFVAWRDNLNATRHASHVTPAGQIISTTEIDHFVADILPVKGGYAAAKYDPTAGAVILDVLDTSFQSVESIGFPSGAAGQFSEGPFVVTDDLNDGRFAIAWIDGNHVAHLIFIGYEGC